MVCTRLGELDVRRRDLGPALAAVRVAHDLDPLPAELHAVVTLLLAAEERQRQRGDLELRRRPDEDRRDRLDRHLAGLVVGPRELDRRERHAVVVLVLGQTATVRPGRYYVT